MTFLSNSISRLIGSLSVTKKLALIYCLDMITVLFVSGILINEKYIGIDFSQKEVVGNAYIGVVRDALLDVAIHHAGHTTGAEMAQAHLPTQTSALFDAVTAAEKQFGTGMVSALPSREFAVALTQRQTTGDDSHSLSTGRQLLTRIGNQSNLILDPDLDSYYTMSLIVLRFPELLDLLDTMQQLAWEIHLLPSTGRHPKQIQFLILQGRFETILAAIDSDYREAFTASSQRLQTTLEPGRVLLVSSVTEFRARNAILAGIVAPPALLTTGGSNPSVVDMARIPPVLTALHQAWRVAQSEMLRLLQERTARAFHRMWLHLGSALALMALILALVLLVARRIAIPLRKLVRMTDDVRSSGDYTLRAVWDSSDEIGRLVAGFNGMLAQLDTQRIVQQDLVMQTSAAFTQQLMIDAIPLPMIVTSVPHHQVLHANEAARTWLGKDDLNPWQRGMATGLRTEFFQMLSDKGVVDAFEVCWTAGSTPSWVLVSARCLDYQGQSAVLATFTPTNQLKKMEAGNALWGKVFDASSESIAVMDRKGQIITVNPAFCRDTALEPHEILGKTPDFLMGEQNSPAQFERMRNITASKGSWQGQVWFNRAADKSYLAWVVMNAVRDPSGAITHFIAMALDITERKANEQRIYYLAHHDALTGLPNRSSCNERLIMSIQQARRQCSKVAVLFLDLDRFKNINDSLGHHVGDQLLCSVANRLSAAVRECDTISRLGGDEFVIILNDVASTEEIGKIIEQRLFPSLRQPHLINDIELYVSCSVGVAVYPDDATDIAILKGHADSAMYQAKKLGRNNFQFFTPELNARVARHLHLETDLRQAVARNELILYYQPRIDARTGCVSGVESLVRWQHPTAGLIPPVQFIPLAEESGLIVEIGAWVIGQACHQYQLWCEAGLGAIPISINLSALQLKDNNLVTILMAAIATHAVPAGQIELELTESILMEDVANTILALEQIKALGFSLSIDDFGTGYSSLNYLCRFPIDKLKIDRSFIQNIDAPDNLAVTKAIISLGHTLGLEVVAEGVEQATDVLILQDAGCDELQGFFFAKPMPASQFVEWLALHRPSCCTVRSDPTNLDSRLSSCFVPDSRVKSSADTQLPAEANATKPFR